MLNKGLFYTFMATTQSPDAQNQLLKSKANMPIQGKNYLEKLENTDKHSAHWACFQVAIRTLHPKSNTSFFLTGYGQHFNCASLVKILQLYIQHVAIHRISTVQVALNINSIPQVHHWRYLRITHHSKDVLKRQYRPQCCSTEHFLPVHTTLSWWEVLHLDFWSAFSPARHSNLENSRYLSLTSETLILSFN